MKIKSLSITKLIVWIGVAGLFITLPSCTVNRVNNSSGTIKYIDPVCEERVNPDDALVYEYQGNTYYFKSEECLAVFKKNPGKFITPPNQMRNRAMYGTHMGWWGPVMAGIMVVGMTVAMIIGTNH